MIASNWKLTYDPDGTPQVLVAYGDLLESDELEPDLAKSVEVVELLDASAPFLRLNGNATVTFSVRVLTEYDTDALARAAMMDGLVAANGQSRKPLRIEIDGITGYYWEMANATVRNHRPKRLASWPKPALVTQMDFIGTGPSKTAVTP